MKTRTKLIFVVSLIVAMATWAFTVFLIEGIFNQMAIVNADRQQIFADESQAASLESAEHAFSGIGENPHLFDDDFVSATSTPLFITNVENLARSFKLVPTIGSVNILPGADGNNLVMAISVSGSLTGIVGFLHHVSLMPYAITIGQMSFSTSNAGWQANIQLSAAAQ